MLSRFHLIPERHGQTDRQIFAISSLLTRDKNRSTFAKVIIKHQGAWFFLEHDV